MIIDIYSTGNKVLFFLEVKPECCCLPRASARGRHETRVLPRGKKSFLPVEYIILFFFWNIDFAFEIFVCHWMWEIIITSWNFSSTHSHACNYQFFRVEKDLVLLARENMMLISNFVELFFMSGKQSRMSGK